MDTAALDYDLPDSAVAQEPASPRDSARLFVPGAAGPARHRTVADLPELLDDGTLVVVNDTRVLHARVAVERSGGGAGEVLLLEPVGDGCWQALCRPSRRLPPGTVVRAARGSLRFVVGEVLADGRRVVQPITVDGTSLEHALEASGTVPLPPYLVAGLDDPERYQTVFARRPGSVAAPTAGLHLTQQVLDRVVDRGCAVARVELVVGLDTFRPVTAERLEDHVIHTERYRVPESTWTAVLEARAAGRPVLAVGTTSVRALESVASTGVLEGRTDLFIRPGYRFAVVDRLLTNFHLPRSSLLALVETFVGPVWRSAYEEALAAGYRFLSFGDASLLDRVEGSPSGAGHPGSAT